MSQLACPDAASCPNTNAVKSVISDYLTSALGPLASTSLRLSAAAKTVDPLLQDLVKPIDTSTGLDECPTAVDVTVFAVVDEKSTFDNLRALLGAMNDDPANAELLATLRRSSPKLCAFASNVGFSHVVPSLPSTLSPKGELWHVEPSTALQPTVCILMSYYSLLTDTPKSMSHTIAPVVTVKDAVTFQVSSQECYVYHFV